jgi:hypothetical protein
MRRTAIVPAILALLLSTALISCSQMFSENLFAQASHTSISASSISGMSLDQIIALTASKYAMNELANDPAARKAALARLAAAYSPTAATATAQDADLAAISIITQSDPDAQPLFASALSLVTSLSFSSTTTPSEVADALKSALPSNLASELSAGGSPPADFVQLVSDLSSMNTAFDALSAGLGKTGGYADSSVTAATKTEVATEAAVAALVSTAKPVSSSQSASTAIWAALCDPSNASSELTVNPGQITSSSGSLAALFTAAGYSLPGSS